MTNFALTAADKATRSVAPLWPLTHFVAVNPFLGWTEQSFDTTSGDMAAVAGARMTADRSLYGKAISSGRISAADLAAALAQYPEAAKSVSDLIEAANMAIATPTPLSTLVDLAGTEGSMTDALTRWAGAYFDKGEARWPSPFQHMTPYAAWHAETGSTLPNDAEALITSAPDKLGLEGAALERYFTRLVMSVSGWSGYARYLLWQAELAGGTDITARDILAIRLAYDFAAFDAGAWAAVKETYATPAKVNTTDLALQTAYELAFQRDLMATFTTPAPSKPTETTKVQAAFCIDVRSEVFRRALEATDAGIETIGFAGFFGVALATAPLAGAANDARCPVLLSPGMTVQETAPEDQIAKAVQIQGSENALSRFAKSAVSSFAFVEALGLGYGAKLIKRSLGDDATPLAPADLDMSGIDAETRAATAKGILAGMSLKAPFGRIILLAGHGASTVNNPHASGLDCGACGGHAGHANARVAAAILNDPAARAATGMTDDTWVIAGQHDTTTDAVTLLDMDTIPASHADDVKALQSSLAAAGGLCRVERSAKLGGDAGAISQRAVDWSQTRPEWGLAGCAAFIAAPRNRTQGRALDSRAFLHSYDWQQDDGFGVLELIMTAPLVVASWINLQYYGSTVDNAKFGSGNKTLHNVVGTIGVLEGNAGDLRSGLPWQSLHDGENLIHEPMRLNAVIKAPIDAMNTVIANHAGLRDLLDKGWMHLFAMDDEGQISKRYTGNGTWVDAQTSAVPLAA